MKNPYKFYVLAIKTFATSYGFRSFILFEFQGCDIPLFDDIVWKICPKYVISLSKANLICTSIFCIYLDITC